MSSSAAAPTSSAAAPADYLDTVDFIIAVESRSITQVEFDASAQAFVDSGVWNRLQGSWQRTVSEWAAQGLVTL